jgi:hypothetical protein
VDENRRPDPIIEFYKQFVDRNKLRENLRLTVDERLRRLCENNSAKSEGRRKPPSPDHPWKPVSDCSPNRQSDPIIELYKQDVDRTLLRENLKLSPEQRLQKLKDFMQFVEEVRAAGKRGRQTA